MLLYLSTHNQQQHEDLTYVHNISKTRAYDDRSGCRFNDAACYLLRKIKNSKKGAHGHLFSSGESVSSRVRQAGNTNRGKAALRRRQQPKVLNQYGASALNRTRLPTP